MHATTPYVIGSEVHCTDEVCGKLSRVVIDPVAREVTHLVVEPAHADEGRLVPVRLVEQNGSGGGNAGSEADAEAIWLRCDSAQFANLEAAQTTEFLPAESGDFGYPTDQSLWMPYYPLAAVGATAPAGAGVFAATSAAEPRTVTYDRVPAGEVQVKRGQPVHATDGEIGKVQGLIVDPSDNQVTHVLLQEGHLWGKKQVAVPIRDVTDVRQGVHLDLTKDEIRDLQPVDIARFG